MSFFVLLIYIVSLPSWGAQTRPPGRDLISCMQLLAGWQSSNLGVEKAPILQTRRRGLPLQQVKTARGLSELMRANVHSYMAWMMSAGPRSLPGDELQLFADLFSHILQILVDSHPGNINLGPLNGKVVVYANDLDDVGLGPAILDVAHYIAATKAMAEGRGKDLIRNKDLLSAYQEGLQGHTLPPPADWQRALEMSVKEYMELQYQHVAELTQDGHIRLRRDGSIYALAKETPKQKKAYAELVRQISLLFPPGSILDISGRKKFIGGSKDSQRFWVLVQQSDRRQMIWELKEDLPPASALVHVQPDHGERIRLFENAVWPGGEDKDFSVVSLQGKDFQLRPLRESPIEPLDKLSDDDFLKLARFQISLMGQWHAQQGAPGRAWAAAIQAADPKWLTSLIRNLNKSFADFAGKHL